MENKIIFITKDVLRIDDLPVYGNHYWWTPNITELAKKGTVFMRHYTAAPSSGMAMSCMFSGLEAYQLDRRIFGEVQQFAQCPTLFDDLNNLGYKTHVILDNDYFNLIYNTSKVFSENTIFHRPIIAQDIGPHQFRGKIISPNHKADVVRNVLDEFDSISDEKCFIWFHAPHVFLGYDSYGSDINLFDNIVGELRLRFGDKALYISADHGHMKCEKSIPVYGFHVYEGNIRIPLITPRINGLTKVFFPTGNVQLKEIILNSNIEERKYLFSDTQYYGQPNRKLAIICGKYKYIYNKRKNSEELYDLDWDPNENANLFLINVYDKDRHLKYFLSEIYFYPYWGKAKEVGVELRSLKNQIWRRGKMLEEAYYYLRAIIKKWLYWK